MGESAVERSLLYPGSAAAVFKRDMGSKKQFTLLHKTFLAEELSSLVLRVLKEDAESYLFSLGFTDFRVRSQNGHGRLQILEPQFALLLKHRKAILTKLKKYYKTVSVDLEVRE